MAHITYGTEQPETPKTEPPVTEPPVRAILPIVSINLILSAVALGLSHKLSVAITDFGVNGLFMMLLAGIFAGIYQSSLPTGDIGDARNIFPKDVTALVASSLISIVVALVVAGIRLLIVGH